MDMHAILILFVLIGLSIGVMALIAKLEKGDR